MGMDKANLAFELGGIHIVVSWVGLGLVLLTAMIIFGGIKRIAKVAESFCAIDGLVVFGCCFIYRRN